MKQSLAHVALIVRDYDEAIEFFTSYEEMLSKRIRFVREPKQEDYGKAAVFEDLYGNLWDLIQYNDGRLLQ